MEKFATVEQAYEELAGLTHFGSIQAELRQCELDGHQAGAQTPAQQQS
jgi:hypothetical protein